jgi:hypothetical protein
MRAAFSSDVTLLTPGFVPSRVTWICDDGHDRSPCVGRKRGRGALASEKWFSAGALAAVDVQDFAGHEAGTFEIENASTMSLISPMWPTGCSAPSAACVSTGMHRRLDDAGRDRVHADAALGVLDRQRLWSRR